MNRIRLLPEHVANQIAAGEVVERPASVVKELVENSLDAGATRITVEIQAGGRSLIRVTDDGAGMSRDDALLCLERHATSKIQRAEDLAAISSMGFRGEALPSIASVSRMTLTTRERDGGDAATQVFINAGKIADVKAAGSPPGTCIEIRQLFYNLPARRKFLRAEETEASHIQHYVHIAALAWPEVAFTFVKDGRTVLQLPAVISKDRLAALRERMRGLLGSADQLVQVETEANLEAADEYDSEMKIWGLIGKPGVSRSTRDEQNIFVNRRPVDNRALNYALIEGYHTALMKGRYPLCCLFLEIHPSAVDVNIHPSKREIKFHQGRAVQTFVAGAVREALKDFHQETQRPVTQPSQPAAILPRPIELPEFTPLTGTHLGAWPQTSPGSAGVPSAPQPAPQRVEIAPASPKYVAPRNLVAAPVEVPAGGQRSQEEGEPVPLLKVPLRLIGVVGRLYVLLESDRGLVLLDQHAAHERILFEQMMTRLEQGSAASQRMLLPETIELSARDAQFLQELMPALNRLGVQIAEFGERTFLLDGLPPFVKVTDPRRFVLGLIDELKAVGSEVNKLRLGEDVITKTVCRHAVKANDPLSIPELERLILDLRHCAMPYTCPHGRPTLIEMNYRELEKKFGRIMG